MPTGKIALHLLSSACAVLIGARSLNASGPGAVGGPEIMIPADSAGVVYLRGIRIEPPFHLTLDGDRVLVNGFDAEPDRVLEPAKGLSSDPDTLRLIDEIRTTTMAAQTRADSLTAAGHSPSEIAGLVASSFRAHPGVGDVWVRPEGGLEVSWRGIPGRQFLDLACVGRAARDGASARESSPVVRIGELAALVRAGSFYAAGVGYRVSLFGRLADSMIEEIDAFHRTSAETLRVGPRRYHALGADLRRAREGREGQ